MPWCGSARDGSEHWIYLHIEIQSQSDSGFAQRMFTYNYRLYDRYARPIASLAVLADAAPGWRPSAFELEQLGCTHRFCFPVVKLLDFDDRLEALEADSNPLALVTAAHLYTVRTRHDPVARFQFKRRLVGLLYGHGWERQRILDLFAILDWMMRLPDALEQRLWQAIRAIEEAEGMAYVTSIERLAIERGRREGLQEGRQEGRQEGLREGEAQGRAALLASLLVKRFGPLPEAIQARLAQATNEQLEHWGERVLEAATLDAVFEDH